MNRLVLRDLVEARGQVLFDRLWAQETSAGQAILWAASSATGSLVQLSLQEGLAAGRDGVAWLGATENSFYFGDLEAGSDRMLVADRNTGLVSVLEWSEGSTPRRVGFLQDQQGQPLILDSMNLLTGGSTPLLAATPGDRDGALLLYRLNATLDRATLLTSVGDTEKSTLTGVSETVSVRLGGTDFVITASSLEDGLTSYAINGNQLELRDTLGPKDGLWISGMEDIAALEAGGQTFIVGVSAQSGTLSAVRINPVGAMFITDIAMDDLNTRFAGAVALDTFETHGRSFIVTGGTDGGIALFELLPGGQLLHHQSQAQDTSWDIGHLRDVSASVTGDEVQILLAGSDTNRLVQMVLPLGQMGDLISGTGGGDILSGTSGDDVLMGLWGDDSLYGGAGDDTLFAGAGRDVLYGGGGADVFVLEADGQADTIYEFELGVDRIDLSSWGRVYDPEVLTIRSRTWGAAISWQDEFLYIHSVGENRIGTGEWSIDDFIF